MQASSTAIVADGRKPTHILIVDDEPLMREALSRQLRREGYILHVAASGNEAFEYMQTHKVQLLVSDVRMPDGDGISLLKKVKSNFRSVPVLLMSGFTDTPSSQAMHLGAEAIIKKPFDYDELLQVVKRSVTPMPLRWQNLPAPPAPCDVTITFAANFTTALRRKDILVGRGGFAVSTNPLSLGSDSPLTFALHFSSGKITQLCGSGKLKWQARGPLPQRRHYLGIEIEGLTEESFQPWLAYISQKKLVSYIPFFNG